MTKITKLNQTFVAKTEATAASQNAQSGKIDEIIDAITIADGTVALPLGASKVTAIGTGLSISGNTLSGSTYTLPAATASSLGGVKVGGGLSIGTSGSTAGVLKVEHDSTLKITDGVLSVTNPGVTTNQVNSAINTALSEYVKVGTDVKYYVTTSENNYSNIGVTIQTGSFNTAINVTNNGYTLVLMLSPSANISMITDTLGTDIKSQFKAAGLTINSNKFYQVYYYSPGGNVAGSYTIKTS